jgi:hypothetical protein
MNLNEYHVNNEMVLANNDVHYLAKDVAEKQAKDSYLTVGKWFRSLSQNDINEIMDMADNDIESLILITMMLSRSEGVYINDDLELHECVNMLAAFGAVASLDRKGLAHAYYDNFSFGLDMRKAEIARAIK